MSSASRKLPSLYLTGLKDLIAEYGQDADFVARTAGVDPAALQRADIEVTDLQVNALIETAALVCDDQFLLLNWAKKLNWGVIAPVNSLLAGAGSVGEALNRIVKYSNEHNPGLFCHMSQEKNLITLGFDIRAFSNFNPIQLSGQLHIVDVTMSVFCNELRNQLGAHWFPHYALFQYASPSIMAPMQKVFGENLYFDQEINALCLKKEDCECPFELSSLQQAAIAESSELAVEIPIDLRVDRTIRLLLNRGECSAQSVADILNTKLRTLQHQLQQRDTNYQTEYNNVRLDLARSYLHSSKLSIIAIAERLRFTDTAAFSNFFRRREGLSPREYMLRVRPEN